MCRGLSQRLNPAEMRQAVGVLCVLLIAGANSASDPCLSYTSLDGNARDKSVITNPSLPSLCDKSLTPGWYRFTGAEVAMAAVDQFHCGAESTIWMDDQIPPTGTSADRKFCFNHGISPKGCLWSEQVPVRNCGKYLVYQFPFKTIMCPMAVCTDTSIQPCPQYQVSQTGFTPCQKVPCPAGQVSASGFEPCRASFPEVTDNVTLSAPEPSLGSGYRQACSFTSSDTSPSAVFKVTWLMNGVPVGSTTVAGNARTAYFDLNQWKGHINSRLTCRVQSSYTITNWNPHAYTSNSYYGGIKIEPNPLNIVEGIDKEIEVISTLPAYCETMPSQTSCSLHLHVISPDLFTMGSCDLSLTPTDWNPTTHEARLTLDVATKLDPAIKANSQTTFSIGITPDAFSGLDIWKDATVPPIQVSVTDTKFKICTSVGDPHFLHSFNPAIKGFYSLYHLGHFNLAGDRRAPIAVQIETGLWHPTHLAVITAIAVQTGSETTIIDTDGGSTNPTVISNTVPTSHTLQRCGTNEYQIYTPMGHRINVYHQYKHGHYLDVKLTFPSGIVSLTDMVNNTDIYHETCNVNTTTNGMKTLGITGEFNDNVIDLFRVNPDNDLFFGKDVHTTKVAPQIYCSCPPRKPGHVVEVLCQQGLKVSDPFIDRPTCKEFLPKTITAPPAKNPAITNTFKEYQPLPHPWPTATGVTEVMATVTCREAIVNFTSTECGSHIAVNVVDFVSSCVDDVRASGSFSYVASAVQAFQSKCETDILSNPKNYITTSTGQLQTPEVLTRQCPNLCSMNGACVKGVCQCEAGWGWTDCSVKTGEPFAITGITGGVRCDTSVSSDCFSPTLTVSNLGYINFCVVTPAAYEQGRPSRPQSPYTGTYSRENAFSLTCNMKPTTDITAQSYKINLLTQSNVGGNSITYVVYNGICQMCDENFTCYRRADACLIKGRCYKSGEVVMIGQQTYMCDPLSNLDGFTLLPTGSTTQQNSSCVCQAPV